MMQKKKNIIRLKNKDFCISTYAKTFYCILECK